MTCIDGALPFHSGVLIDIGMKWDHISALRQLWLAYSLVTYNLTASIDHTGRLVRASIPTSSMNICFLIIKFILNLKLNILLPVMIVRLDSSSRVYDYTMSTDRHVVPCWKIVSLALILATSMETARLNGHGLLFWPVINRFLSCEI